MKYLTSIAALALLAGCSQPPATDGADPEPAAAAASVATANVEAVQTVYDGFAAGDIATAISKFSPDIVWNEAEGSPYSDLNPYEGPDAIVAGLFARLGGEWDYFNATPSEILPSGDTVVVIGRYEAKHKATGKTMDIPFVHVWTLKDGALASFQQYTDTATHTAAMTAD